MIRVGLVIVLIAIGAALLGPTLTPYDPASQELAHRLEGPSLSHPLGLDELDELWQEVKRAEMTAREEQAVRGGDRS